MNAVAEEWRSIPGFPDYEASSLGNIRNAASGKLRSPHKNKDGYRRITLSGNAKFNVARLICLAFYGVPEGKMDSDHKDSIRDNDAVTNLQWLTRSSNLAKRKHRLGENHPHSKLTNDDVLQIRTSSLSSYRLASLFGVSPRTIRSARSRECWAHVE